MRILMLIASYYPELGGAEVFAREIAERSVRVGDEVDVVTGLWDRELKRYERFKGVNIHRVKVLKGKYPARYLFNLSYILSSAVKAIKLDRERDYNIVHSVMESSGGVAGAIVKKLRKKPHLVTVQGGTFLEGATLWRRIGLGTMVRFCFRNAEMVHGISRHLVEQRADRFGAKAAVVIPNGVDVQRFHLRNKSELRKKYGFPEEQRVILSVCPGIFRGGPFTSPEGYPSLIEALAALSRDLPDLRLVIVGEGPKRETFQALGTKLGVEDSITFLGTIPHEELPEYYGMADVFVRPRTVEGLGTAYIEAMACGVPVIGANVGGTVDVIDHGKNGLLVSPYSPEEISQAIRLILEDEAIRSRFTEEGLKRVEQEFRWEATFDKINNIYESLATPRPKG